MADNNIQILLNSGFDAFSNLYQVTITVPPNQSIAAIDEIRIGDFKPPEMKLGEYPQHFKTASLTRLNAMITGDREFPLTFRIDKDWALYDSLKKWRSLYFDVGNDKVLMGMYTNTTTNTNGIPYGTIEVKVFKGVGLNDGNVAGEYTDSIIWTYKNVILYDLTEPSFKRSSSDPVTVTAKFIFGEYTSTATT